MRGCKNGTAAMALLALMCGAAQGQCASGWQPCGTVPGPFGYAEIEVWDPDGVGPLGELVVCTGASQVADVRMREAFAWDGGGWIEMGPFPWSVSHPRGISGETLIGYRSIDPSIMRWDHAAGRWRVIAPAPYSLEDLAPLPDGDVLITWRYDLYQGHEYIARWDAETATYGSAGVFGPRVRKLIRSNGRVYASGEFTQINGQPSSGLARYEPETNTWTDMPRPVDARGHATELEEIGGQLHMVFDGVAFRQDPANGQWIRMNVGLTRVNAIAPLPNGEVFGVGSFYGTGTPRPVTAMATYAPATNSWTLIGTRSGAAGGEVARMNDGSVVVAAAVPYGGGGIPFMGDDEIWGLGVVQWDPIHRRVRALGEGLASPPKYMVGLADGSVLCGGEFPSAGNLHTGSIVRFDPIARTYSSAGGEAFVSTLDLTSSASGEIRCISTLRDGTAGVFAWDEMSNSWADRGSRWSTSGQLPYATLGETGEGALVVWYSDQLRVWDETSGVWRLGPAVPATISNHRVGLTRGEGSRVIVAAGGVASWDVTTMTLEPFGAAAPTSVWGLTRLSNGDLLATGDQLRRWHHSTDEWRSISNATVRNMTFGVELPDGDLVVGSFGLTATGVTSSFAQPYRWDALTDRFWYFSTVQTQMPDCAVVMPDSTVLFGGTFGYGTYSVPSPRISRYARSCPLHLTLQPTTQYACLDHPIAFSANAFSTYPFVMQWRRNNVPLVETPGRFEGTATPTLTVFDRRDAGSYTCVVTDSCGSITTRFAQLINCVGDYDCSTGVDSDDTIAFFADWERNVAEADLNRDGDVDGDDVVAFFVAWDRGC